MKQLVCTILVFLLCHAYIGTSYADVSTPEIISKIKNCLEAKNPRSITEYVCTKGDFVQETEQPLRDEETAYLVIMSIKFNDIDRQVLKEMEKLQKSRMTDGMSWVDYIHTAIGAYGVQYLSVCTALGGNLSIVALWKKDLRTLPTLNAFPQNFCRDLAMRKAAAWENMGYILASKGSSK